MARNNYMKRLTLAASVALSWCAFYAIAMHSLLDASERSILRDLAM